MPLTTTHALVPFAGAIAFAHRPVPWRLIIVASIVSAAPDLDAGFHHFLGVPETSILSHRGATHSLFVALCFGAFAAICHRLLEVRRLTAAVVIASAMASHGLLDMMSDGGRGVAYLWPISSNRFFAEWRPLHTMPISLRHIFEQSLARLVSDAWLIIVPLFAASLVFRGLRQKYGDGRMLR